MEKSMTATHGEYFSPWWITGPHLQTIWSHLFRRRPVVEFTEERLELDDGDFLDIAWTEPVDGPLILLFHGLEGSIDSVYMLTMLSRLRSAGFQVVMMNFRSCGPEVNRLPRAYHSGETGDMRHLIQLMLDRYPGRKIGAAGFSLGGNVLLKYLGEEGKECPLFAAAAVSAPCSLEDSTIRIHRIGSRFYEWRFLHLLKRKIQKKKQILQEAGLDWKGAMRARSFREFDDLITAPAHGFVDASDYYTKSSSFQYLSRIGVNTLLLQSRDDPMLGEKCYPSAQDVSDSVRLEITENGGHVGWVSGSLFNSGCWMEDRILRFFQNHS